MARVLRRHPGGLAPRRLGSVAAPAPGPLARAARRFARAFARPPTRATALPLAAALALTGAACGAADRDAIVISGSSTVQPVSSLVAEAFHDDHPAVAISVNGPGTGDGFQLFCNGEIDIADASRAIKEEEVASCEANDVEFVELMVGIDGITVLTSPQNEAVDCVSFLDLYALLGPESTGFRRWSSANDLANELAEELDISEFGPAHTPYPDQNLVVTGPGEESGTFDSFVEIVIEGIAEERGEDATTRPDYISSPNDNVIIDGIASSPGSLGWVGFAFYEENQQRVDALAVDAGEGCVEPEDETIADGTYPVARPLYIYVDVEEARRSDELRAFVDLYLSPAGLEAVSEAGYVPLPEEAWEETKRAWEEAIGGTPPPGDNTTTAGDTTTTGDATTAGDTAAPRGAGG